MITASSSAATLRRVYFLWLVAIVLTVIAGSLSYGARHITETGDLGLTELTEESPADASLAVLQAELAINLQQQTSSELAVLALDLALGLAVSGLIVLVVSGVMLFRTFKREGPVPFEDLDQHLAAVLTGISVSASLVLDEARRKEADVQKLEENMAELKALASIEEGQARALKKSLNKSAKWGVVLGVLSVVCTIGIAIWSEVIR